MKKTVKDIPLKGKRVLMRVDFNVPQNDKGEITDDSRIKGALPTINYVLGQGAKLVLMSHLGRPDGQIMPEFTLKPVAERLTVLTGKKVVMTNDCIGHEVENVVNKMKEGEVVLLENLRFHKGETKNDKEFAKSLSKLGDIFVEDAFGTCHRAHASTAGVTEYLPGVAGFLVEKEIEYFDKVTRTPEKPFSLILGGSKVSDKILMIENMLGKIDNLIIGGAMAYTFLKAMGKNVGNSKVENDKMDVVNKILSSAKQKNVKIYLPIDHVIAKEIKDGVETKTVKDAIPEGWLGLDIGIETIALFKDALKNSKTIVWNGPLGLFEKKQFAVGTLEVAKFISTIKTISVIGGGDTAAAIIGMGLSDKMSHISTGGGASLECLEGKEMPGIKVLQDK
ncbi:phosphoglycerate kinase [Candidatus Omnitrophus magneticus]|uniref:Phosphoglycerate kinase n=1 Tax=Candidatus Omnitrophus magneticus TaxID=1609969 RepID=A0A0F0CT13_9BACT|nr:phosphoglycerate kinase [Candidatus Omnitrophus magneticus]